MQLTHTSLGASVRRLRADDTAALAITVVAAFLRLWPIASGLPYIDYVDEGHVLHQAIKVMQEKTYDVGLYQYPALPAYLIAAGTVAYSPAYRLTHDRSLLKDLPPASQFHSPLGEVYDLISPPSLIVVARTVVAVFSVGTVILTGVLARVVMGRTAGLIAVTLLAVCPAAVNRGSIVIVDTIGAFFVVATLWACARLAQKDPPLALRWTIAAGSFAALAFVSKYPLGAICAAVVVVIAVLNATISAKLRLLLISGAAFVVTSCAMMPSLILKPAAVIAGWRSIVNNYGIIKSVPGYWGVAIAPTELGLPLVLLGLGGIVLMLLRTREERLLAAGWVAFAVVLLAGIVWAPFQPFRNLLSLVPLLCISAAALLVAGTSWLQSACRLPRSFAVALSTGIALLLAGSLAAESLRQVGQRRAEIDTRVQAVDWLTQHARAGDHILAVREAAILPAEWMRIGAKVDVVPWFDALGALDREQFDYIISGEPDLRLATDPPAWASYRERWSARVTPLPVAAAFGQAPMFVVPYLWRTNDERIMILRAR